jgi:IS5 family transposase
MHQTKKGKNWYFGMNAHVGVDSKTKIIHTAVATAAHVSDLAILPDLLHGEETRVWGDTEPIRANRGEPRVCAASAGLHSTGIVSAGVRAAPESSDAWKMERSGVRVSGTRREAGSHLRSGSTPATQFQVDVISDRVLSVTRVMVWSAVKKANRSND